METDPSIVTKVYECFFIEFSTVDIEAHRCLRLPPPPGLYAEPGL